MGFLDKAKSAVITPLAKTTAHQLRVMAQADMEKASNLANTGGMVVGPPVRRSAVQTNTYDPGLRRKPSSSVSFETLRRFSKSYEVARICINVRKRWIGSLDWDIVAVNPQDKTDYSADKELLRAYFKNIGGYRMRFRKWQDIIIEDLSVLDAGCLYKQKNRVGDILYYMNVDAATIKLRVDDQGNTPMPPEPAFMQYINGNLTGEFTADEMIYEMMNPRSDTPYGLAPLESLVLVVSSALKGTLYNLDYLTEGNVPEGFLKLPENWSTKQISEYMDYFDALVSGDSSQTTKVKPIPGGANTGYEATKKRDDMAFKEFNEWLLKITCAMFEIPPQEIGFTMDSNKANSKEQSDIATKKGMLPLANLLSEMYDDIIQIDLGFPHLKFKFEGLEDRDQLLEAQVQQIHAQSGIRSVDEIRKDDLGLEPVGIDQPYVLGQATFLKTAMTPNDEETDVYDDNQNDVSATEAHGTATQESNNSNLMPDKSKAVSVDDELNRLVKYAIKRSKLGKAYRPFDSDILDPKVLDELNARLAKSSKPEAIKTIVGHYQKHREPLFLDKAADDSGNQNDYQPNPYLKALVATAGFKAFVKDFKLAIAAQAAWTANEIQNLEAKYIGQDLQDLTPIQQANLEAWLNQNLPSINTQVDTETVLGWYVFVANKGVQDLYDTLGNGVKFNLTDSSYKASLLNQADQLLNKSSLDNTTRQQLAKIIAKGRSEGKTIQEIGKQITEDFKDISKVRADMIAYTETVNTLNKAQFDAMYKAGVALKEWVPYGNNVCPICLMNVGDGLIPMDAYFSSGDFMPTAHVNCECSEDFQTSDVTSYWDGSE